MTYNEIAKMPTALTREYIEPRDGLGFHESLLRAFHIVQKVKWLCDQKTSPEVIRELIDFMEAKPE